ncbi:hypothetical protein B0H13DRAFT_1986261 [Mycena leptocephala]|nr:hypothetical protein B0H13DRAFT_1986261 [Mycena leptocephala]
MSTASPHQSIHLCCRIDVVSAALGCMCPTYSALVSLEPSLLLPPFPSSTYLLVCLFSCALYCDYTLGLSSFLRVSAAPLSFGASAPPAFVFLRIYEYYITYIMHYALRVVCVIESNLGLSSA